MKIGFCGTMSVGKTTLVKSLELLPQFKDYHIATERSQYLSSLGIPLNTDSTLKGQSIFLAERCAELMREDIITDRTVIDVMAFTQCAKSISYLHSTPFENHTQNLIPEYDHVFYVSPIGVDIENNGIRETDSEYRDLIDDTIKSLCKKYHHKFKNFHVIEGSNGERIKQVVEAVEKTKELIG